MITNIHEIAAALHARRTGTGWIARCPAHEDRTPSLAIREKNGRILVRCHAGCEQAEVIAALRERGLWPEREKHEWRRSFVDPNRAGDMVRAVYWAHSVRILAEWLLETTQLNDPARMPITKLLRAIRMGDESTLAEYRSWQATHPEWTAALVYAGRLSDAKLQRALARWIEGGMYGEFIS